MTKGCWWLTRYKRKAIKSFSRQPYFMGYNLPWKLIPDSFCIQNRCVVLLYGWTHVETFKAKIFTTNILREKGLRIFGCLPVLSFKPTSVPKYNPLNCGKNLSGPSSYLQAYIMSWYSIFYESV